MRRFRFIYIALTLSLFVRPIQVQASLTPPSLVSESAILIDGDTGQILYEKRANTPYAPASITKLMTALLTLENLAPNEEITFSRKAVLSIESGSSHIGMRAGETITVEDALHGLLLNSANEVANGLAEAVSGSIETFAQDMTSRAKELGGLNSNFLNPHGLYEEDHVTTAYDMALITKELLTHDYFLEVMGHPKWQIAPTNLVDETRYLHQGHKLLNPYKDASLYREDTIAGKSGYTRLSGYTLVTVSRREERTLIAVSIRTDANHLYSDTNALLDYGFEAFHSIAVTPDLYQDKLPIMEGEKEIGEATIAPSKTLVLQLPNNTNLESLSYSPEITTTINRLVALNTPVGSLDLSLDQKVLGQLPLEITEITLNTVDEVQAQVRETPVSQVIEIQEDDATSPWPMILAISLVLLILGLYLAYLYQAKTMSYMAYKKQRDAQRNL